MENVILYFVKYPHPGQVKTRLAKSIGELEAADLYRLIAEQNLEIILQALNVHTKLMIVFAPTSTEEEMAEWLGVDCDYLAQKGKDLTARLTNAFDDAYSRGLRECASQRVRIQRS